MILLKGYISLIYRADKKQCDEVLNMSDHRAAILVIVEQTKIAGISSHKDGDVSSESWLSTRMHLVTSKPLKNP